jgi:cell division protease FtsH
MVCELGMSDEIGPLHLGDDNQTVFLGRDFNTRNDLSDETARKIDSEIRQLIEWAQNKATEILTENRELLTTCSKSLLERETIHGEEFKELIAGRELPPLPPPLPKPIDVAVEAIAKAGTAAGPQSGENKQPKDYNPDKYRKDP